MQVHTKLYSRAASGAILVWWMESDGNKYRSHFGHVDGAIIPSGWIFAEAKNVGKKNARTAEEQALYEVKNKYKKQLKSGDYWESINDIDKSKYFHCMLAHEYNKKKWKIDWDISHYVQIKFNGVRCIATKDGLFTRKGEKFVSIPHIEEYLKNFFIQHPNAVLDGELFNYDLKENLNELVSLVRKTSNVSQEDINKSKDIVRYYIYDGFGFKDSTQETGYATRKETIDSEFYFDNQTYKMALGYVDSYRVRSEKDILLFYNDFISKGHEGLILRILKQPYENKRSDYLLKLKPVDDGEYLVISVNQGSGFWHGRARTLTCKRIDGRKFLDGTNTFDVNIKGNAEETRGLFNNAAQLIEKVVTIQFNGYNGFLKPNFAQFDVKNFNKGNVTPVNIVKPIVKPSSEVKNRTLLDSSGSNSSYFGYLNVNYLTGSVHPVTFVTGTTYGN